MTSPLLDPSALRTPVLVIDLEVARRNLRSTLAEAGSAERWRPHVKTAKIPEVMALYLEEGVHRFKCATLREAEVLSGCRAHATGKAPEDILVAHHLFGPSQRELRALAQANPKQAFSTLVESPLQVPDVPAEVGIFVDLDLGMNRTGLSVEAVETIVEIARKAGPQFRGLHAYDGHRHEPNRGERERLAHAGYRQLLAAVDALGAAHAPPKEIITSGTPAYPCALSFDAWGDRGHTISPGTVVYHDLRTKAQLAPRPVEFAATVWTRVASLPADDLFTVDAGSKAIEAASPDLIAGALEIPSATALRQSEEHTVFRVPGGTGAQRPARGTLLRLVPGHVCPTVNLASTCLLLDGDRSPRTVAVAARGH